MTIACPRQNEKIYYFAFGSNMCQGKMQERLGHRWRSFPTFCGVLHGWRLAFNVVGYPTIGEPSFASIAPCSEERESAPISPVCGMIYEMDHDTFDFVKVTEACDVLYSVAELEVECISNDATRRRIKCHAFTNRNHLTDGVENNDLPCSKRYRDLLIRGSRESQTPHWYSSMLEAQIPYVDYGWWINWRNAILVKLLFLYLGAKESRYPGLKDLEEMILNWRGMA